MRRLLIVLGFCLLPLATSHAQSGQARPNVLLILADDLGHALLDPDHPLPVPTPHIQRLRNQGVTFTAAYSTAPVCGPSRAALLTGRYQQRVGFEFNPDPRSEPRDGAVLGLRPGVPTLPVLLNAAGYDTALIGKWHLGSRPRQHPLRRGFDEFFGFLRGTSDYLPREGERDLFRGRDRIDEPEYLTDAFAREAVAFIERPRENPFFLYLAFNAIHEPARSPPGDDRFPAITPPRARRYAHMIASLDDAVGRVLDTIDATGQSENTIVLFLSDNGGDVDAGINTNGDLRLGKQFLFEGGIRVPLIIRWPGVTTPASTLTTPATLLDITPTLLAAASITQPSAMLLDGRDLRSTVRTAQEFTTHSPDTLEPVPNPDRPLFWRTGAACAVRIGDYKLIRSNQSVWLFNLASDPVEANNLADAQPERVAELGARLDAWLNTLSEPDWTPFEIDVIPVLGLDYERAL